MIFFSSDTWLTDGSIIILFYYDTWWYYSIIDVLLLAGITGHWNVLCGIIGDRYWRGYNYFCWLQYYLLLLWPIDASMIVIIDWLRRYYG